ncbi:alpha/beta fold hydrolase [Amycolatopsis aidingensis]|uniref:alpha/beta fold hydrolase n=1 Tax=Amycolatopsis aidingensis TaxID=2842453 RepID=UPI001C0AF2C3|nr:alpha/beta hydrolase [Amycolatopsis aidingensis]
MPISEYDAVLHGHQLHFWEYVPDAAIAGAGTSADEDVLVLLHGIAGSGHTWMPLLAELERRGFDRRVLVPDLPGHGESASAGGDYSVGAFANTVRDLLLLLGHQHATVLGHSLGGGIAMQFAYQFPEMCGRLGLVGSGGLGPEVTVVLRATSLPGAKLTLRLTVNRATLALTRGLAWLAGKLGLRLSAEGRELARHLASLADPRRRTAFVHTARSLIDLRGQRVSATNRLYLAAGVPTLVAWGNRDWLIPPSHAHRATVLMPGAQVQMFNGARHFPHVSAPERFAEVLTGFLAGTTAARLKIEELRSLLLDDPAIDAHISEPTASTR